VDQTIRPASADRVASAPGSDRLVVLDALRGFAALGILWRNIFVFGLPTVAFSLPEEWGENVVANVAAWLYVVIFVDGTMRGMFSLIFGATALLLLDRHTRRPGGLLAADLYFRRLMWLIVFGLVHGYVLLWPHDVLYVYGILGMFLFAFRNMSGRRLLLIGLAIFAVSSLKDGTGWSLDQISNDAFDASQAESLEGGGAAQAGGDALPADPAPIDAGPAEVETSETEDEVAMFEELERLALAEMDERLAGYTDLVRTLALETFQEQTTLFFTDHVLDVGAMMFFGMALFRLGAFSGRWTSGQYAAMAVIGLAGGLVLGFLIHGATAVPGYSEWSIGSADAYLYNLRRLLLCLGLIGLANLLARDRVARMLLMPFTAVGRIPLTTYVGQTVICVALFYGVGLGLFGTLEHHQLLGIAFAINLAQVAFAFVWLKLVGQGPLEALLRRLVGIGIETDRR
jgi:uncharacterized protein